jgi:hypothetical protein
VATVLARKAVRIRVYDVWLNGAPAGRIEVAGEPASEDRRVTGVPHLRLPTLRGLLRRDPATGLLPVIRHRCDEASCHRPSHWVTGPAADFTARERCGHRG